MRGQVWGLPICFSCLVTNAGDVSGHMYTEIKESTCRRIARDCSYMTSCIYNNYIERSGIPDTKQEHCGVGEEELHLIPVQSK